MNCAEIASTLQETLLHQRDSRWVREARRHAERCPGCARLLELHRVEESLARLLGIEPASDLVESVMNRVMQPLPVVFSPPRQLLVGTFKNAAMFVGALVLAYRLPQFREPVNPGSRISGRRLDPFSCSLSRRISCSIPRGQSFSPDLPPC